MTSRAHPGNAFDIGQFLLSKPASRLTDLSNDEAAASGRLQALTQAVCRRRGENGLDWQLPAKGLKDSHSDRTDGLS